jgi:proteasome lid subunit RPN8/RPN11
MLTKSLDLHAGSRRIARSHAVGQKTFVQQEGLTGIPRFAILSAVLDATRDHLQSQGGLRNEGAVCWGGTIVNGDALITTVLMFTDAEHWGGIHVSPAQTGLLYAHCHARGLTLLAQVHSHPRRAFHSDVDERAPHSAEPGFLSAVVPNFGTADYSNFTDWAVFEQVEYEQWRPWGAEEKRIRLHVLDSVIAIP